MGAGHGRADRPDRAGHRQPDQRHRARRRRHLEVQLRVAGAGRRAAVRRRLRRDRHGRRWSSAAASGCSSTGRTATRSTTSRRIPPTSTNQTVRNGLLQTLGTGVGVASSGVPTLINYRYDNPSCPSSLQWNAGVQMALPWASSLDVSYVGQHSSHVLNAFQSLTAVNINAIDFGAAFLPQNQDPTPQRGGRRGRRLRRLRAGAAPADPRLREHRPAVAGVRAHLPLDAVLGDAALPQRRLVRRQLHAEPERQRARPACRCACSTTRTAPSPSATTRRRSTS